VEEKKAEIFSSKKAQESKEIAMGIVSLSMFSQSFSLFFFKLV